jgi:plastocyanin
MTPITRITRVKLLIFAAVMCLGTSTAGLAYASGAFATAQPTSPTNYTVNIGGGHNGNDFTNISYTPDTLNIFVGDKVTFTNADSVEPHTVTFGDYNMLNNLANNSTSVHPNKNGPPTISLLPKVVEATKGTTYNGTGFANSGVLSAQYKGVTRNSWTIKFTKAGTFQYYCLIHFPYMIGTIVVNPRPTVGSSYTVQLGYGGNGLFDYTTAADTFFPENLTIHAGDTVQWQGGGHTVTFGNSAQIAKLRTQFVLKTKGKNGQYQYDVNPQVAFPSSQNGCGSSTPCSYTGGFLNSGIIGGLGGGGGGGGGSFAVTFPKAGVYNYGCLVHKGMDGQITVLPAVKAKKA